MPAIDPEMDAPTKRIGVARPILMDVEVVEAAPTVALPSLPTIIEEEAHAIELSVSIVLVEPITTRLAKEEEPIVIGSSAIDTMGGVALATVDALTSEVVGVAKVPTMAGLPLV